MDYPDGHAKQPGSQQRRQRAWETSESQQQQYPPQALGQSSDPSQQHYQQQLHPEFASLPAGEPQNVADAYQRQQQLTQHIMEEQQRAYYAATVQQAHPQQYLPGGYYPATAAATGAPPTRPVGALLQPMQLLPPVTLPATQNRMTVPMPPPAQIPNPHHQHVQHQSLPPPLVQPPPAQHTPNSTAGRLPADRPLVKLSVSLIDTYKHINTIYYEERATRRARDKEKDKESASSSSGAAQGVGGTHNDGWDDENFDYIITQGELFCDRYKIKERIGKGSFGQVVRAEDVETRRDVAIKIIKSKKPFLMQAKTEIELLSLLCEKDRDDQHNIVRLLSHFMFRNHQCIVFEMLSLNLYELLKNTQFGGVSLKLIRKFAKQVLRSLLFLARKDVDIIHCDLKPENILLRHPKKSGVKVIDFGSSCRTDKRMYSYIQSRFYRSPEVILGLPYTVAIDMWSLGCILAEMHTGEPLFSGSNQFDQMQKIVKLLGMLPAVMLDKSSHRTRGQFFEKAMAASGEEEWRLRLTRPLARGEAEDETPVEPVVPSVDPIASLSSVITAGARQKTSYPQSEAYNSKANYEMFIDLISKMLAYLPEQRIKPADALNHPFITSGD